MNKVAILIFALAITHVYGTCSADLGTYFGLTITLANPPATGNELPTVLDACVTQQGALSCCTAAIATTIKNSAGTLQTSLETDATTRDKAILLARKNVAAQKDNYAKWVTAATAAGTTLTKWTTTQPSGVTAQQVTDIKASITTIKTLWDKFFTDYTTLRTAFTTYQSDRAACFTQILKDATAAKCLACFDSANYATYGIGTISAGPPIAVPITHGAALLARLAAACRPYFISSETVTQVFLVERYATKIADMTTALNKIAAETVAGAAEFITASAPAAVTGTASSIDETTCTVTTCPWLNTDVFTNGKLNQANLIQGGAATTRRRMLTERSLQGNSFNPAVGESKVTATFPNNPGNVNNVNDLSALRVGVFSCIVAFFVALLI